MSGKMFHYASCGLRNIWLRNGFVVKETTYGKADAIHDVEGLHRAIGLQLASRRPRLSGAEVHFLRKELDMSQAHLAKLLGTSENSLRGWEKHRTNITKPGERFLRTLYCEHVAGDGTIRELVEPLSQLNRDAYKQEKLELEETPQGGWGGAT